MRKHLALWARLGVVLLGASLFIAGGAVAFASTRHAATLTACVHNTTGAMRLVASAGSCRSTEHAVTWNKRGPIGRTGPQGPAGPSSVDVALRETSRTVTIQPGFNEGPTGIGSGCADGEAVVGGGITASDLGSLYVRYVGAGPFYDGQHSGWLVQWINDGTEPVTIRVSVSALCVPGTILNFPD